MSRSDRDAAVPDRAIDGGILRASEARSAMSASTMLDGVILLSGVPGAGKSTIGPLLAAHFERGVHIEADTLQRMIVSRGRWPDEDREEGLRQLRLRGRNACLLADSFRDAGFVPVIDDIVIGRRLDEFVDDLRSRPVYFVLLTTDLEVLRRRHAERAKADVFHQARDLDPVARNQTAEVGLRIDNSHQSAEQSVGAIVAGLGPGARIA